MSELVLFHVPGVPRDLCQRTKNAILIVTVLCSKVAEADTRRVYPMGPTYLSLSEFLEPKGRLRRLVWLAWLVWVPAALGWRARPSAAGVPGVST